MKYLFISAILSLLMVGCNKSNTIVTTPTTTIQVKGSDTMVNLAQAWAEEYVKTNPAINVEVCGGGSGVGIAALEKGIIDIANSSRNMKPDEIDATKKITGKSPVEFVVGYDALGVYVHIDNPINEITIEQLAQIYVANGKINKWSDIGIKIPNGEDNIVLVNRQSSSGTYEFFRDHVLNKKDFRLGSRDMNGSKEVVELVSFTKAAIGYSGMGYNIPGKVKMLKIAKAAGIPSVEPTMINALNKSYPLSRSLLCYTLGEPAGELKKYLDWCVSPPGQKIVEQTGYVPLPIK